MVLPALQGKGPVRQRSILADLIFGSFHQGKEQSQPAAIERANVHNVSTFLSETKRAEIASFLAMTVFLNLRL